MRIHELAQLTGVSTKTIRYYESIGLLPAPQRAANNYREYTPGSVERLRFIVSARSLDFGIPDIAEFLTAGDAGELPCQRVMDSLDRRIDNIDRSIANLLALRGTLDKIRSEGKALPVDEACDQQCVCYLITTQPESGQISIRKDDQVNV